MVSTTLTGSTQIWTTWTSGTTSSANYSTTDMWENWLITGTASTTIHLWQTQQPIWQQWDEDGAAVQRRLREQDEWQARREQRSRERLAEQQARMEEHIVAYANGMDLLTDLLTDEEVEVLHSQQYLLVEGQDGRLYRIETHRDTVHGNIVRTDEHGCVLGRACVAPQMWDYNKALPTPDGWVGQYLGLRFDTVEFLSHANWSQVYACRERAVAAA